MLKTFSGLALRGFFCCSIAWLSFLPATGGQLAGDSKSSGTPFLAPASSEGELAIKGLRIPAGFKTDLVAAEPHLANPVAFYIDEKGRFYVCETFRLHEGVTDIRGKDAWLDEDLASRTVDDRLAMMKRHVGDKIVDFATQPDRLRLIEDRDGDGVADHSTVFADGFDHALDGIAAGVLVRNGTVWFANIPHLWMLRDTNSDGVADERKSLHYGYGVRVGFLGHDLHGLRFGPDGKLYFSIGDRGSNVETGGRRVGDPEAGSVFRCNPDGSDLEVFAYGLRNPQELAFDDYGNLFTGDNNSDGGDRARWVYVVEGGDSGWRVGYQFIESPNARGPWNSEKMWHPQNPDQPAFLVPPLANITDGPSGLTYYPGTGMPDSYKGHFFLCDFHGSRSSGIYSFTVKPRGASFEVVDLKQFLWDALPTDVEFGPKGGLYYTDWVQGWGKTGKGRIYRIYEPSAVDQDIVKETARLLAEGMNKRSARELARLLAHPDQRIRQEAQFTLAERGQSSMDTFVKVARRNDSQLARLHAIWGIGQIGRNFYSTATDTLLPLLNDSDAEVRAQAAKVLADARNQKAYDRLVKLLQDNSPRVRYFAAIGVGKLERREAVPAILAFLRDNGDQDPYLRHAGVMALTWINDFDALEAAAQDSSKAVRMGALLAMRRMGRAEIARFLNDSEPALVTEAARAINDRPIPGATAELAALIHRSGLSEPALRRVVNANFRMGLDKTAKALAEFSRLDNVPENARAEALQTLANWEHPSGRDRVTGLWRPIVGGRNADHARQALAPVAAGLFNDSSDKVRLAAVKAVQSLRLDQTGDALLQLASNKQAGGNVRAAALETLADFGSPRLGDLLASAANDESEVVRKQAARLQARIQPSDAAGQLARVIENGSVSEKQNAFATLGTVAGTKADEIIAASLDKLIGGQLAPELQLDVLEAAAKRSSPAVKEKLAAYEKTLPKDDALAPFRVALLGGDAKAGRTIFFEKAEASCLRCHRIQGEGGGEVGPDLTGLGTKKPREYILESILYPNRALAPGFETVIVMLKNGSAYAGTVTRETDSEVHINSPEDGMVTVKKADIQTRERGLSGMPEGMENILTKHELRNLIEFLSTAR